MNQLAKEKNANQHVAVSTCKLHVKGERLTSPELV